MKDNLIFIRYILSTTTIFFIPHLPRKQSVKAKPYFHTDAYHKNWKHTVTSWSGVGDVTHTQYNAGKISSNFW